MAKWKKYHMNLKKPNLMRCEICFLSIIFGNAKSFAMIINYNALKTLIEIYYE